MRFKAQGNDQKPMVSESTSRGIRILTPI
uniref:Uncharacterized protein n=1 Tax=Rhizophora mucronata TaxID=61149 RepID=A0A2P2Q040_RHIMU